MNNLPNDNYKVTVISPHFFKAAAKVKAEKAPEQKQPDKSAAVMSYMEAMSTLGRSGVQNLTLEERKERLIQQYTKEAIRDAAESGIDESDIDPEEMEQGVRAFVDEQTEMLTKEYDNLKDIIREKIETCSNTVTLDELEKANDEASSSE